MKLISVRPVATAVLLVLMVSRAFTAPLAPPAGETWRYQLLGGSWYLDDCPPCAARPSFQWPLRGSFVLGVGTSDPLFTRYELRDVRLTVGGGTVGGIRLEGTGALEVGGEVALVHRLTLRLTVKTESGQEVVNFDSGPQPGEPKWPWLDLTVTEVNPSPVRVLSLHFDTMPIRDLWFSTRSGFTAGLPGPEPVRVSAGELLSDQGRVVVSLGEIRSALQLKDSPETLNVDAAEVAAGGVFEFSLGADAASATLGTVHHGDLVSLAGNRVKSFADFGAIIGPMPPAPDLGLDAVHRQPDGTLVFSTQVPVFSERLGVVVGRGDLMASDGKRQFTNQELLKAFHPLKPDQDYGLDAVFVWPSGEVWFSTEDSVELEGARLLLDGDLLSSTGRVIYGNLELLQWFGPLEDAANFGLDALVIATDATESVAEAPVASLELDANRQEVRIRWTGKGRFFSVERAASPGGPFTGFPLVPGQSQTLPLTAEAAFYRVRQW